MLIELRYNQKELLTVRLKDDPASVKELESSGSFIPQRQLDEELRKNITMEKLKMLLDLKKPVVVVVDDQTRKTPVKEALRHLWFNFSKLGFSRNQVTILVANGTHRFMTGVEMKSKLGDFPQEFHVEQHNCYKQNSLVASKDGIPIYLNNTLLKSSNVIGIGSVLAHKFSGWSGGSKIISPGVCGYETVFLSHKRSALQEIVSPGQKQNWFRTFIDYVGRVANLKLLINFVMGASGPLSVFAGEPQKVFDQAVREAKRFLCHKLENKYDVTVVSAYPSTKDLWQTGKSFYLGDLTTRDEGHIIVVSSLEDGFGDHPKFAEFLSYDLRDLEAIIDQDSVEDPLAIVAAIAVKRITLKKRITVVTKENNIPCINIKNFEIVPTFPEKILKNRSVVILKDSYVLPVVEEGSKQ